MTLSARVMRQPTARVDDTSCRGGEEMLIGQPTARAGDISCRGGEKGSLGSPQQELVTLYAREGRETHWAAHSDSW